MVCKPRVVRDFVLCFRAALPALFELETMLQHCFCVRGNTLLSDIWVLPRFLFIWDLDATKKTFRAALQCTVLDVIKLRRPVTWLVEFVSALFF